MSEWRCIFTWQRIGQSILNTSSLKETIFFNVSLFLQTPSKCQNQSKLKNCKQTWRRAGNTWHSSITVRFILAVSDDTLTYIFKNFTLVLKRPHVYGWQHCLSRSHQVLHFSLALALQLGRGCWGGASSYHSLCSCKAVLQGENRVWTDGRRVLRMEGKDIETDKGRRKTCWDLAFSYFTREWWSLINGNMSTWLKTSKMKQCWNCSLWSKNLWLQGTGCVMFFTIQTRLHSQKNNIVWF